MDRRWSSGPGGLYFSLILRPKMEPSQLPGLSLALGEACAGAIGKLAGIETTVKPPNDVLGRNPSGKFRKICGILTEASGDSKKVHWLAAGIGVNVNNRLPKTLAEASSLAELTGRRFDLSDVLDAVLEGLRQKLGAAARSS
jgi:BirA family biotin operon repressor/biotin-[acetyl-CoA-carboxylase] ligase